MGEQNLLRKLRLVQILVVGFWVAFGGLFLIGPAASRKLGSVIIVVGVLVLITVVSFELRARAMKRTLARVRQELGDIAKTDLDAPAELIESTPGELVTSLASNPKLARLFAARGIRYFVAGAWRGKPVELGTNVLPSRDTDTRISYVLAGPSSSLPQFRAIMRGTFTAISRMGMQTHAVATGDAAFDAKWIVDGENALVTHVLDERLRARLMELLATLKWNMAHTASIESIPQGVIVRWPGELDARFAASLRDLAFDVRARLESAAAPGS